MVKGVHFKKMVLAAVAAKLQFGPNPIPAREKKRRQDNMMRHKKPRRIQTKPSRQD
jgi:hypothetical protein